MILSVSFRKRDRDRTSQGTHPTQKQRTMLTKTSGYLDSLCVDQEEGHALEKDVKEEGGVTEEGVD